ncbi:MAG: GNAT family N-acetyltransferase, partial [Gammaproteobacteria bacterium]
DYLGVSFGATPALLRFWQRAGFHAARLGIKRGKASGEHSITMVNGKSTAGETLAEQLQQQFTVQFLHQITDSFKMLDTELLALLLADMNTETANKLTPLDQQDIKLFANAKRAYATVSGSLNRLTLQAFSQLPVNEILTAKEQAILLACVVQQRDQDEVVAMAGLSGRGELIERLRGGVGNSVICLISADFLGRV